MSRDKRQPEVIRIINAVERLSHRGQLLEAASHIANMALDPEASREEAVAGLSAMRAALTTRARACNALAVEIDVLIELEENGG